MTERQVMNATFFDLTNFPPLTGHSTKKVLSNSEGFHVWVHIDEPGKTGPMHKHTADQLFYCVQGECTFRFPNNEAVALRPGMLVTIPAGQFYQLHNSGSEKLILLGSRGESAGKERRSETGAVVHNVAGKYVLAED
jgi:mannose-6-phosphate isomerase-like protein (cupin superfamily)